MGFNIASSAYNSFSCPTCDHYLTHTYPGCQSLLYLCHETYTNEDQTKEPETSWMYSCEVTEEFIIPEIPMFKF